MKQLIVLVLVACLLTGTLGDAKRSLGRGSSSRGSSSSSSSRRTSSHATSRPATSRPISHATSRPISHSNNADATRLSYPSSNSQPNRVGQPTSNIGWNVNQNKPVGPPPAYTPHNPAGGARPNINEKPPSYTPIRAATQRPIQSSYPKQPLPGNSYPHNSALPANAGPPKYYPVGSAPSVGYHPAGSVGGGYHPPAGGATYFPAGHAPSPGYHPGGFGGGGYHPQSPPVYAPPGVQPGYYPAGSFPKSNSGPGLGTGLIAGALGGAILGHVLTPTHNNYGGSNSNNGNGHQSDSDRVIIINNTPGQPATVTTQDGHQPVVVNNAPANPDASVPLAPFQPGSTQTVNQPAQAPGDQMSAAAAAVSPPLVHSPNSVAPGQTNPEGTIPLAEGNTTTTEPPKSGGVMCYPVLVNVTSETDPTNITTVEQIACYEVPAGYDPNAPQPDQQSTTGSTMSQKPDLMQMSGEQITQRTSTATLAESSQIKQNNGVVGQHSAWSTITSTIAAIVIAYCLQ